MAKKFAENTTVPWDKSRSEIEKTLEKYSAKSFAYGWQDNAATIMFDMNNRRIRFILKMPTPEQFKNTKGAPWQGNSLSVQQAKCEQETRRLWRAFLLVIKAKLESVASGVAEFEDEFMAHIVLPNGQTAGQWMKPQIARAYETRGMPPLLLSGEK